MAECATSPTQTHSLAEPILLYRRRVRGLRASLAFLLAGALAGCSNLPWYSSAPAPELPTVAQSAPPPAPPVFAPPPPAAVETLSLGAPSAPILGPRTQPLAAAGPTQLTHRVGRGDTVYSLARRYGTTPGAIQAANGLDGAFTIKLDQPLVIPTAVSSSAAAPLAPPPAAAAPRQIPSSAPSAAVAPRALTRPVEGPIVTEFGARTGGAASDGVDFAAAPGAPVGAAADGSVAFVSDDTGPLGSVILVQHGGGMVTIYGRVAQPLVKPGQAVTAGQQIARVAAPRSGARALMHFELRRGSTPVDPTGLF